ncbi:ribosome small subunit-dependent GTPase A [Acholeplasma sp. OttesenSCG-928-E16]|nr:ribosome small subunit-dependent GTPase A [Acholeplasma sp. OttesenSCG-928-E16]
MKKALVTKLIAGQYQILDLDTALTLDAVARGKLRFITLDDKSSFLKQTTKKTKLEKKTTVLSPKPGDYVLYQIEDDKNIIIDILERKNELKRPDVANIDQVILVFSCIRPDFSLYLLDKFLIIMEQNNLTPLLVISKIDLVEESFLNDLKQKMDYYKEKLNIEIYYVNSKQRIGVDVLEHVFKDKISVLAGQTGVGKSTLINALIPGMELKTQEISKALGRGKHTTRHSELYSFKGGFIADTPGFSKIEFQIFNVEDVKSFYKDFIDYSEKCKYSNKCLHLKEPNCGVKDAVEKGLILKERYENYVSFTEEVKNQKIKY